MDLVRSKLSKARGSEFRGLAWISAWVLRSTLPMYLATVSGQTRPLQADLEAHHELLIKLFSTDSLQYDTANTSHAQRARHGFGCRKSPRFYF